GIRDFHVTGVQTCALPILMKKGVYNVLQPLIDKGDIKIVYDQWTQDWAPENAKENMAAALSANGGKVDAVIAANDATAGGAIEEIGRATSRAGGPAWPRAA